MGAELARLLRNKQANNEAEQTKDGAEDLDDQDLDESMDTRIVSREYYHSQTTALRLLSFSSKTWDIQRRIRSIGEGGTAAVDADSDTTDQVARADGEAGPEQGEAGVVGLCVVELLALDAVQLGGEDDGHDDAVDRDDFAKNNGDKVFGSYPRCFDTTSEDRGSSDEDAPTKRPCVSAMHQADVTGGVWKRLKCCLLLTMPPR